MSLIWIFLALFFLWQTNLCESVVFNILTKDLKVCKCATHLVPTFLSPAQKEVRAQFCDENLRRWRADTCHFLSRIITCDETWLSTFELETKRQASAWLAAGPAHNIHTA